MAEQQPQQPAGGDGNGDATRATTTTPAEEMPRNPLADLRLRRPPFWMIAAFLIFVVVSWIPLVVSAKRRVQTSEAPPIHLIQDMDHQPRYRGQQPSPVFADGRSIRPKVVGTVSRGDLQLDDALYRGYTMVAGADGKQEAKFFEGFPAEIEVNQRLLQRGQLQYNIYCAPCHGNDGLGQGPVHQRAVALQEAKWVPPTNLHDAPIKARPNGHIYNTIANGIRNMPPYRGQITDVADRWAVVAYVRALQLSQDAPADVVPAEKLTSINR